MAFQAVVGINLSPNLVSVRYGCIRFPRLAAGGESAARKRAPRVGVSGAVAQPVGGHAHRLRQSLVHNNLENPQVRSPDLGMEIGASPVPRQILQHSKRAIGVETKYHRVPPLDKTGRLFD